MEAIYYYSVSSYVWFFCALFLSALFRDFSGWQADGQKRGMPHDDYASKSLRYQNVGSDWFLSDLHTLLQFVDRHSHILSVFAIGIDL